MFSQLIRFNNHPDWIFNLRPDEIAGNLESYWAQIARPPGQVVPGLPNQPLHPDFGEGPFVQHHLIYAYMIERTRILQIFRRVLQKFFEGEELNIPSAGGQQWLRTTEALFFKDAIPSQIYALTSYIRPDLEASRRNAYYRMFGMEIHGTEDNKAYPYPKPEAVNKDFVPIFEKFLVEVWRGISNFTNTSGPNTTDDAAIANLVTQLHNMLTMRRRNGNLAREEFFFVAMMSWFHLTVLFDSPIIVDLNAEAASPEDRLKKAGERVGLPAHEHSRHFFVLAEQMSILLTQIELQMYNDTSLVPLLYQTGAANSPRDMMMRIVMHWSMATGHDIKAGKTSADVPSPNGSTPHASVLMPAPASTSPA